MSYHNAHPGPLLVRPPTDAERRALGAGLRSSQAFTLRRAQILMASRRGEHTPAIAAALGCSDQTVRDAIHAFDRTGVAALTPGSKRPHTRHPAFDAAEADRLCGLLHRSPRDFGHPASLWALELAAATAAAEGPTATRVTGETIRATPARLGIGWKRTKRWITSPDSAYARKKSRRDRPICLAATHPDRVLGFADEVWWSRVAQPAVRTWAATGQPRRLVERAVASGTAEAVACYGLLVRRRDGPPADDPAEALWLRFVEGRRINGVTTRYLDWCCERLAAVGKAALLLVWDSASWHVSREVAAWIAAHNWAAKATGEGVRTVSCPLPVKSPWLNPIEPKWVHGKRRVVEPLTLDELETRVSEALGADQTDHLTMPKHAA